MRFGIGSLLIVMLVALPLAAGDKKAAKKDNDRERQFNELKASFETARKEAIEIYRSAKTDAEKKAAAEKFEYPGGQVDKILKLIEADPKDDLAFRMLAWELKATNAREPKIFDLLMVHHIKNPAMVDVCSQMPWITPETTKLLRKVFDENPDRSARGWACLALARQANFETMRDPSRAAEKAAEADKLYARVLEEYADVKTGEKPPLGELAKKESRFLVGKTAPEITSENLNGDKVHLTDYRGKVVVLDIWATWCGPCRAMIPHEREMVEKLRNRPFTLVGISFDQKKDTLKQFLDKEAMPWTHWWNGQEGGIAKDWNITHFPTIYVLDAKGVIRYKEIRGKQLEEAVEKLLAEMEEVK